MRHVHAEGVGEGVVRPLEVAADEDFAAARRPARVDRRGVGQRDPLAEQVRRAAGARVTRDVRRTGDRQRAVARVQREEPAGAAQLRPDGQRQAVRGAEGTPAAYEVQGAGDGQGIGFDRQAVRRGGEGDGGEAVREGRAPPAAVQVRGAVGGEGAAPGVEVVGDPLDAGVRQVHPVRREAAGRVGVRVSPAGRASGEVVGDGPDRAARFSRAQFDRVGPAAAVERHVQRAGPAVRAEQAGVEEEVIPVGGTGDLQPQGVGGVGGVHGTAVDGDRQPPVHLRDREAVGGPVVRVGPGVDPHRPVRRFVPAGPVEVEAGAEVGGVGVAALVAAVGGFGGVGREGQTVQRPDRLQPPQPQPHRPRHPAGDLRGGGSRERFARRAVTAGGVLGAGGTGGATGAGHADGGWGEPRPPARGVAGAERRESGAGRGPTREAGGPRGPGVSERSGGAVKSR